VFSVGSAPRLYNEDPRSTKSVPVWRRGSNTSTVTLRVVRGDEEGRLKSETVKCGREYQGTRTRERLRWPGPPAYTKDRPVLSAERSSHKKPDRNWQTVINIWSWAPNGARHQDLLTDWPWVVMWLWFWLWLWLSQLRFDSWVELYKGGCEEMGL
jgi:hypothetical protein